jgi:hypothetical protein
VHTIPLSYPIWQSWKDSPSDSWPTSLRSFWYDVSSEYAELSAIADWIEYWTVRDLKLTYVCCPFYSPAMQSLSIVKKVPFKYVLDLHK